MIQYIVLYDKKDNHRYTWKEKAATQEQAEKIATRIAETDKTVTRVVIWRNITHLGNNITTHVTSWECN